MCDLRTRKHEDLDRAINAQEEKINALQNFADQLTSGEHYDKDDIENKKDEVMTR